jgi:flavin-dependent thymidylate synthase
MKVDLIDYTGAGHPDPLYAARLLVYTKNTRLEQGNETLTRFMEAPEEEIYEELDYISKTLRSSWEFVQFTFQIKGVSRAFTHQLVRTRTASYAQQAQRVVDMSEVPNLVPVTVAGNTHREAIWDGVIDHIADGYAALKEDGVPNQDCRGLLPTNVLTNIVVKMDLRTLADVLGKRKNLRAQGEYADVARGWEAAAMDAMPWIKPFIDPERTMTPALDELLGKALGDVSPIDRPRINEALKELDNLKGVWG